jgi:competence protein ComEC
MKANFTQTLLTLGLLAFLVWASVFHSAQERGDALRVWFFDIGQGDAILIDTPEQQQILIDGGPNDKILARLGEALPLNDKYIDLVVLTHNHSDHLRGVNEVLKHYQVGEIWVSGAIHTTDDYLAFLELVKKKDIKLTTVTVGQVVKFGELEGIVLYPFEDFTGQMPSNQHDASVVTFWQYGQTTLLLTGDAEARHERAMARLGVLRPTTIQKVGHHGSRTSTSETLLEAIRPELAIIQVGRKNMFDHPHPEVVERLERFKIPVLRNDLHKTILLSIWPDRYEYQTGL